MPQELPGFYFDAEKNRYFPIKGPIPGTSRSTAQKPNSKPTQASNSHRTRARTSKLLQVRELSGNLLSLKKGKCNFKEEFQKRIVSQPTVWKYLTDKIGDGALEQIRVGVISPEGQYETDLLLAGSVNGFLSFFEVGKVGHECYNGVKCIPKQVWPLIKENKEESYKAPDLIWRPDGPVTNMSSSVSCIKSSAKHSTFTTDDGFNLQRALYPFMVSDFDLTLSITTLGSDTSGGSVYVLNFVNPLDSDPSNFITRQSIHKVASFKCTIWTADYSSDANQAVIGTDLGAAVVNLETGRQSWVFRSKSDVLAQQLQPLGFVDAFKLLNHIIDALGIWIISIKLSEDGNVVLCGLRNGAIVTVDIRERPGGVSNRLIRHRLPYSPLHRTVQSSNKQWFELRGNICPSCTVFMPSSISSLVSLHFNDQYFLASSMDGSVKLYDHRLIKRGPVQSYEGHVNSHTRIQLGVDQSERFVMSGGEDCNLRIWSIKSGELLFEDRFSNSIPSNVCWRRPESTVTYPLNSDDLWERRMGDKAMKIINLGRAIVRMHGFEHRKDYSTCTGIDQQPLA
ncbi:hypothetical protein JRO89_XSUnG0102600 [Xanthoceras sorbifolium]|uniref:Uncharacterized protein n=1 Tax=Xanthoceras sorbifolium TaxID=99658 RepID=A0ABQ8GYM6_9ROSI|nr:hypothetical protein JRO89_XSUnG0102600 [Xanthoceras sorbifolium]